jgi:hypothetical protein
MCVRWCEVSKSFGVSGGTAAAWGGMLLSSAARTIAAASGAPWTRVTGRHLFDRFTVRGADVGGQTSESGGEGAQRPRRPPPGRRFPGPDGRTVPSLVSRWAACGQPLDPLPPVLLAFGPSPSFPTVDASSRLRTLTPPVWAPRRPPLTWAYPGLGGKPAIGPRSARHPRRAACTTCGQTCGPAVVGGSRRRGPPVFPVVSTLSTPGRAGGHPLTDWSGATHR